MSQETIPDIKEVKPKKSGLFRFQGARVFLTYSQVPAGFNKNTVMDSIHSLMESVKGGTHLEKYHLSDETHKDTGKHVHAFFWFSKRIDTTNPRFFDVDGVHPNIQKVTTRGDPIDLYRYISKEDPEPLSNVSDLRYPIEVLLDECTNEEELLMFLMKKQTSFKSPQFISMARRYFQLQTDPIPEEKKVTCSHNPQYFMNGKCLSCLKSTGEPFVREADWV